MSFQNKNKISFHRSVKIKIFKYSVTSNKNHISYLINVLIWKFQRLKISHSEKKESK